MTQPYKEAYLYRLQVAPPEALGLFNGAAL